MTILLPQIHPIAQPQTYKLHLACWNGQDQPLDVFVRDRNEWDGWNAWRGLRDDFSREHIFSLIDFYPEKDMWLFGGAYRVLSRKQVTNAQGYNVEIIEASRPLIGRLKISLKRPARAKAVNFENYYQNLVVAEILAAPYSGQAFCGYDQIDLAFPMLENIISVQRTDWKAALEHAKGVYLITDTSNGKQYVGSAYGDTGIWSRWACYAETGHGGNRELKNVIQKAGLEYARKYFKFALLEHRTSKTDDRMVLERECYWKDILLTREPYGYNRN